MRCWAIAVALLAIGSGYGTYIRARPTLHIETKMRM